MDNAADYALEGTKKMLQVAFVYAGIFAAAILLYQLWYHTCGWFDFSRTQELGMPASLWLCFGSHGDGSYSLEDATFAAAIPNLQARSQALWQRLWQNYKGYTFFELLSLWKHKFLSTWNNGSFDAMAYTLWPANSNWSAYFTQPNQRGYFFAFWFAQAYMLMLYWGTAIISVWGLRCGGKRGPVFLLYLCLFGVMLYLMFFETAPRRALLAMPLCILACVGTLALARGAVAAWLEKMAARHEKAQTENSL